MYKVFLVDDEPYVTEGLNIMIDWKRFNCEVVAFCRNGREALERMNEVRPDIIITDVRMPIVDGVELVHRVNELDNTIKCILLTGYDEFKYAADTIRCGVRHYLLKPIDVDELHEALNDVCQSLRTNVKISGVRDKYKELSAVLANSLDLNDSSILMPYRDILDRFKYWHYIQVRGVISVISGINMFIDKLKTIPAFEKKVFLLHSMRNSVELAVGVSEDSEREIREMLEPVTIDCEPTIHLVVGAPVEDAQLLTQSYRSAELRQDIDLSNTTDKFIFCDGEALEADVGIEAIRIIDEIFAYIETLDFEKGKEMILETYRRSNSLWYKNFYSCFVYKIAKTIAEYGGDSDEFFLSCGNSIYQGNNLSEMQNSTIELYDSLLKYLADFNKSRSHHILDKVEMYIKEHYREEIFIKDLAKMFFCNPVYIGNAFYKRYDLSIKDYIHRLRINESVRLMEETDMTISDIAYKVGYNNYNNYYAHFERIMGVKPIDYRRKV